MQQPSPRRIAVRNRRITAPQGTALPLAYRLPNPPPIFVGRRRESSDLAGMIKRAPVTVVCGIGGVGKTSLVLATLRRRYPAQVDRTVMVSLRPTEAPGQLQLELVRALAGPLALTAGWATRAYEPDAYAQGVIDLAERAGLWVVLDDIHHGDAGFIAELLTRVARFARRCRWIATTRVRPGDADLAHQTLALGAMAERELDELARRAHPEAERERRGRAVRASSGSPWQLLCTLSGGDARNALPEVGEARALFEQLSLLEVAVPVEALVALGADSPRVHALERAGLVERTARGVRVHDVARSLVDGDRAARARGEVGRALAASRDPAAALEGVRLLLAVDDATAAAVLNARAGEWIEDGYAPRLWRLVGDSTDPRLRAVQLRCAGELGHAEVVTGLPRPPADDAESTLWWARAQFAIGRCREAGEVATALLSHGSPELAFDAGVLLSRCYGVIGRLREAVAVLDGLTAPTRQLELLRDAHRARWLLHTDAAAARALAGKVQGALDALPEGPRREAAERICGVYVFLGHHRAAIHALPELGEDHADLFLSREIVLWRLAVATMGGRLGEAAALIHRLRTMPIATAQQRQYVDLFDIARRITVGELAGLDQVLSDLLAQTAADGNAHVYQFGIVYREKLAVVRGDPAPGRDWAAAIPAPIGLEADHLAVCRAQHALRWGQARVSPADGNELISVQVVHAIARAEEAMLAGEREPALAATGRAISLARDHGQVLLEADATLARCEVAAVLGGLPLIDAAAALGRLADTLSSPRLRAEARFFASMATGFDPAVLEDLATLVDVAPAAARRSRRLLGCDAVLDAVDTAVVARLGQVLVEGGGTYQPGWGLDPVRKAVWLPGRWIDLATAPLSQQIIAVVADAGGAISKDDLVCRAWGESEYHPLRHDKRMQIAVHRLRKQIEDDPAAPRRLVTTPDGYALSAGFRRVSRRSVS